MTSQICFQSLPMSATMFWIDQKDQIIWDIWRWGILLINLDLNVSLFLTLTNWKDSEDMENRAKVGCTVYLLRFIFGFFCSYLYNTESRKWSEKERGRTGSESTRTGSALTGYTTFFWLFSLFGVREVPFISFVWTKIAWTFYFKSYRFRKTWGWVMSELWMITYWGGKCTFHLQKFAPVPLKKQHFIPSLPLKQEQQ